MSRIEVTTIQPQAGETPQQALPLWVEQIRKSRQAVDTAGIVVFPEYYGDGRRLPLDERQLGAYLALFGSFARAVAQHVVTGSALVSTDAGIRNRAFVLDPFGNAVSHFDKQKPFSREPAQPGEPGSNGIIDIAGFRVSVLICADLWWPELSRALCNKIDIMCVPARTGCSNTLHATYARRLWHSMALTRAMENGMAVVVSDHAYMPAEQDTGKTNLTAGAATVCDPSQRPDIREVQSTLGEGKPGLIQRTICHTKLREYRTYRHSVQLLPDTI